MDNYKYKISKIHKWLLEKEIDTKEMTLIVMFSIIFLFVSQIRNLIIVFKRRKIDKMSLFIDDLQGVLDIKYGTLLECPKEENHSDFV